MTHQRGSLQRKYRKNGETWILRYRVTASDGRRVENTIPVGLLRDFPKEKDAWREVDKLGLAVRINEALPRAASGSMLFVSTISRPISVGTLCARNRITVRRAATSKTFPAKNRLRGKKREADPTSTWERPKTLGKNQAYALSGTAVVGAQATEERFAE